LAVVRGGYRVVMADPLRRRNALFAFLRVFKPGTPGLGRRIAAIPRLISASVSRRYDGFWRLVGMLVAAIYIVSPIDLIPELVFGPFGLIDDAAVAAWLAGALLSETERFLEWERTRGASGLPPNAKVVRVVRAKR
jgi:uncharacterized membrane protein YkvA (DUF1232 family)